MIQQPELPTEGARLDYSDEAATLGDRLTAAREVAGLELGQLAQRVGVRANTLHDWEENRAEPRANRLQMLAGMLDVSLVWLISGSGEGPRANHPASACLAELDALRAEQARIVTRMETVQRRLQALLT